MLTKGSPPDEIERKRRARNTKLRRRLLKLIARLLVVDASDYEKDRIERRCG
jgi:hypothetical protein